MTHIEAQIVLNQITILIISSHPHPIVSYCIHLPEPLEPLKIDSTSIEK